PKGFTRLPKIVLDSAWLFLWHDGAEPPEGCITNIRFVFIPGIDDPTTQLFGIVAHSDLGSDPSMVRHYRPPS
ncbi:hypothetical protein KWH86_23125, partial [Enterobacter cloacae]|uniref:hypothetical protein n=1 Tax=Enterobacter cloacae TaxID=550 RepID=UPI0021D305E8